MSGMSARRRTAKPRADIAAAAEERVRRVVRALVSIYGMKPAAMAAALGRSESTWFSRVKGETAFQVGELAVMADMFGVDVGAFYSGRFDLPDGDALARPAGFEPATYRLEGRTFVLLEDPSPPVIPGPRKPRQMSLITLTG